MKRLIPLIAILGLFCVHDSFTQVRKYTNANSIEVMLINDQGSTKLIGNDLLTTYDPSLGIFRFHIDFKKFNVEVDDDYDEKLRDAIQNSFEYEELIIRIYEEHDPINLDKLKGDNETLLTKVDFGDFYFQDNFHVWRWLSDDNLIFRLSLSKSFDAPVFIEGKPEFPVSQIKIYSEHIEVFDFLEMLN